MNESSWRQEYRSRCQGRRGSYRSPGALVDRAVRERTRNGFDLVFAISDKDNFEIESALRKADRRDIPLIISNPCFEAWLVFHFEDCRAVLSCPKDAKKRLRRHVPDYDKTALRFADFEKGILDAAARTRAHGGDITVNPTSTMWRLVDELHRTGAAV
ncbi:RloB family protein [Nocardia sp. IBHARD005]|uniref:RloB family protein n=1 Tax=Nocardia sp. IBHARD005 TaxID=3457765 RepID=UPI0040587396